MSRVRKSWGTPAAQSGIVPGIQEWAREEGSIQAEFSVGNADMTREQVREYGLLLMRAAAGAALEFAGGEGKVRLVIDIEGDLDGVLDTLRGEAPVHLGTYDGSRWLADIVAVARPWEADRSETVAAAVAVHAGLPEPEEQARYTRAAGRVAASFHDATATTAEREVNDR